MNKRTTTYKKRMFWSIGMFVVIGLLVMGFNLLNSNREIAFIGDNLKLLKTVYGVSIFSVLVFFAFNMIIEWHKPVD